MNNKNLSYLMVGFTLIVVILFVIQHRKINNLIQEQKKLKPIRNLTKKFGGISLEKENRTPIGYQIGKSLS